MNCFFWVKAIIANYCSCKFEVSSWYSFGGLYKPKCAQIACTAANAMSYARCTWKSVYLPFIKESVALHAKSVVSMAAKTLKWEQHPMFWWEKRTTFLMLISTQSQQKKWLATFFCAAAMLAWLQLWQQLRIMGAQCDCMSDFFEV